MATAALARESYLVHCLALCRLERRLGEVGNVRVGAPLSLAIALESVLIRIPLARENIVARHTADGNEHVTLFL